MKSFFSLSLALVLINCGLSQEASISSRQLTDQEVESMFTDSLKTALELDYSIYRVYEFEDEGGEHLIVMTEHQYGCDDGIKCYDSIKAFCYHIKNDLYTLEWKMADFILRDGNGNSEENSISFWTKYFELDDYDYDGFVDPIMVYGTNGMNGTDDGRIKILVYHNRKKRAIRHQNGVLDFERNTQVDEQYYDLPIGIQNRVHKIMEQITENNHGIFPYGWQEAMKNKELRFDEN